MDDIKEQKLWVLIVTLIIFIALLFTANYIFAQKEPGGTDFLYRWLPTRLVFFEGHENPYSAEVEYLVELVHHGHAHEGDEIPGMFAYPYYTMFAFLPVATIKNFILARSVWMTLMELAHVAIIFLTLSIIKYRPKFSILLSLFFFSLFNADFAQALVDGNPSSLAALFIVLTLFFLSKKFDHLAGIFLALSTIKPHLAILFFALVWLWAFSKQRWTIIYTSLIAMLFLLGTSFLLQPSWLIEFIKDVTTYTGTASPSTPRAILSYWMPNQIADKIAWGLTLLSVFVLFNVWKKTFKEGFSVFFWATSITFALLPFVGITTAKSNYITMLPGVIWLLQHGEEELRDKSFWLGVLLWLWIPLSWFFFYTGRTWVVGDNLIYFLDFYPMPTLLLILYFFLYPSVTKEKTATG